MATITDIAKAAGVSSMTVSRVLNGDGVYLRPTFAKRAEAIRDLAKKMGYRPNAGAMAMRKGRFDCVALLLSSERTWSLMPDAMLAGIQEALVPRDMHLTVGSFSDKKLTNEEEVPKLLRELSSDGLLINYNAMIPEPMIRLFRSFRLPSIWINSKHPGNSVYADDYSASVDATERLIALGHRRIAYLNYTNLMHGPEAHYSFTDRWAGYKDTMTAAGLVAYRYGDSDWRRAGEIVTTAKSLLLREDRPTAAVCYGYIEARAIQVAAGIVGLDIPRELSITTFGEKALDDLGPMVTTSILPEFEIGLNAVDMLIQKIANPPESLASKVVAFGFETGATIASVSGNR